MDVFIYEAITSESLKRVKNQVRGTDDINLRINSLGGSVFEGFGIHSYLNSLSNNITTHIDGFAGSIATLIMLSGNTVTASKGSFLMIHRASSLNGGNINDLESQMKVLKAVDKQLIDAYHNKTKLPKRQIAELMDNETIMTAEEARSFGFVDTIGEPLSIAANFNFTKHNMENVLEKLKAQAGALLGNTSENEETQEMIDQLAKEAEEKATAKVEEKIEKSETPAEAITAELVKGTEFLAFQSQMTEFVNNAIQFIQEEKERNDRLEKSIPELVDKALNTLLSSIKSKKEVPASTNQFSDNVKINPEVDFSAVEAIKSKIQEKNKK
jgi:ATP-dependent protease ClpP protease subunit